LQFTGAVYHVTSRGNARQKVFFNDADRELFLRTLSDVVSVIVGSAMLTV
jgi:putative transposase